MKKTILIVVFVIITLISGKMSGQWITNGPFHLDAGIVINSSNSVFVTVNNNVFRSDNSGLSWYRTANGVFTYPRSVAISGNMIVVGTTTNVYRSYNLGQSWSRVGYLNKTIYAIAVLGSYIYAGTNSGVLKCGVSDTTWIGGGLKYKNINCMYNSGSDLFAAQLVNSVSGPIIYQFSGSDTSWNALCSINDSSHINSMHVSLPNILVAKTGIQSGNGLFRSTNSGQNWTRILTSYGYSVLAGGGGTYAGMSDGIYYSSTGGTSFVKQTNFSNVNGVSLISTGSATFAGISGLLTASGGGVLKTTNNGQNWVQTGINSLMINSIIFESPYIFVATDSLGVFRSNDNGSNWTQTSMKAGWFANSLAISGSNVFVATMQGIYKLTSYGGGLSNIGPSGYFYSVAVLGMNVFAGKKAGGVYRSTTGGGNWVQVGLSGKTVRALCITPSSVIAGTDTNSGIYRSVDNGSNWTQSLNGISVYSITGSENKVYAGTSNGVYLSTNHGANWTSKGLSGKIVNSVSVINNSVFAGTNNDGIYYSGNSGESWIQKNDGFDITSVKSVCATASFVYAGITGGSVWQRPYNEIIGIKNVSSEIPSEYKLEQNYPNPFNSVTSVKFKVASSGTVLLKVFDLLGREVAVLVNEKLQPGIYQVNFNAENLSSGIYFYRLITDCFSETKKLVLMK